MRYPHPSFIYPVSLNVPIIVYRCLSGVTDAPAVGLNEAESAVCFRLESYSSVR
jgi:hypothetical protein